jgi:zinc protease
MRTGLHLALAAALLAALVACPDAFAAGPSPAHHVCADGLEVVVSEMDTTPLVTVEMGVRAGAMVEDDKFSGVSHLYEHMFFKGNAAQPDQMAYLARLRALGMTFDGATSDERVSYFFTTTSDHLSDQMTFMRDAIVTPRFDARELERERVVVTGEIDRDESEPPYHLSHAIETHVFWKYPTRKWAIGKRASVVAATIDMMHTLQKRYFVPNNALLAVTGDVKADDVFALADKLFTGWAKADDPSKAFPVPVPPPIRASEVVLVAQPVEDLVASIVWQGPSTLGPTASDTYPLDLLAVLAGDPGSRFQKTLVDSGACTSAGFWYYPQRHTGEVGVDLEATPDKVDACVAAAIAELPKLKAGDYFSDEELRNAARRVEVGRALERETTLGRAHALTFAWGMTSFEYDDGYEGAIRAMRPDGIAGALDRWVLGKPFVMGAMASLEHIDAGLTEERLDRLVGVTARARAKSPPAAKSGAGQ